MSYLVLARKYRPRVFGEVIGQDHISRTLVNAMTLKKLAHAYIFSGPRGVGKTTMARILAKALNCKASSSVDPCNTCPTCVEITKGSFIDIIEIDGATNRGIDEIRALRENVKFTPVAGTYKVYIIDEAHQITVDAYNALLKTIEEPPGHVLFILATTDPHKIPVTIFSRCQRFVFRPLSAASIEAHLRDIAGREAITAEDGVFPLVAGSAGGSLRDALSVLDQLISFSQGTITEQDARYILGYLPGEYVTSVLEAVARHSPKDALAGLDEIFRQGHDLAQLARNILECFHALVLVKSGITNDTKVLLSSAMLKKLAAVFSEEELIRNIELLDAALIEIRRSGEARLVLQVCLYTLAMPYVSIVSIVHRLETMEQHIGPDEPLNAGPAPSADAEIPQQRVSADAAPYQTPSVTEGSRNEANNTIEPTEDYDQIWRTVRAEIEKHKPSLASSLKQGRITAVSGDSVTISFSSAFACSQFDRQRDLVRRALGSALGVAVSTIRTNVDASSNHHEADQVDRVASALREEPTVAESVEGLEDEPSSSKVANNAHSPAPPQDAIVQTVMDVFKDHVVSVKRKSAP